MNDIDFCTEALLLYFNSTDKVILALKLKISQKKTNQFPTGSIISAGLFAGFDKPITKYDHKICDLIKHRYGFSTVRNSSWKKIVVKPKQKLLKSSNYKTLLECFTSLSFTTVQQIHFLLEFQYRTRTCLEINVIMLQSQQLLTPRSNSKLTTKFVEIFGSLIIFIMINHRIDSYRFIENYRLIDSNRFIESYHLIDSNRFFDNYRFIDNYRSLINRRQKNCNANF